MDEREYLAEYAAYLTRDLGKNNISQNLFQRFKELITDGRLPAGYMLPNENVVSELLGVGRSTLREAYTALAVFGFIRRSKAGTYINEIENIVNEARELAEQFCEGAKLKKGMLVVMGSSSSEVRGSKIGSDSSLEVAEAVFGEIYKVLSEKGVYLAVQCCEHLNRAIVTEKSAFPFSEAVNVIPQPKAGGSLATKAYQGFENPVVLEEIKADAGMDIGFTLIGMHLKKVAVPLRLENNRIGEATVIAARSRPKFIGGERAHYDDAKK